MAALGLFMQGLYVVKAMEYVDSNFFATGVKNTRFSFCGRTDGVASREAHHGRAMPGEFLVFFDRSWPQSGPVWVPRIVREQQPRTQPTSGRLDHHGSVAG